MSYLSLAKGKSNEPAAAVKKLKSASHSGWRMVKACLFSAVTYSHCTVPALHSVHLPVGKPVGGWIWLCGSGWSVVWLTCSRRRSWDLGNSYGLVTARGTAQANCCSSTAGGSHPCLLCVPALHWGCEKHGENTPKHMLKDVLRQKFKYNLSILIPRSECLCLVTKTKLYLVPNLHIQWKHAYDIQVVCFKGIALYCVM